MKYFTRAYINGAMSEKRAQAAYAAYTRKLSALSPALRTLGHLYLHDALFLEVTHNPSVGKLTLRLRCGDLQVRYADATLTFSQVTIGKKSLQMLRDAILPSDVEVLTTELDVTKDDIKYRLLLWPKGEVTLKFKTWS
jgi:hypothetical protein